VPTQLLSYSQVGFWWRTTIIDSFASVLSLELIFMANLLDREHRGHPCWFKNRIWVHRAFSRWNVRKQAKNQALRKDWKVPCRCSRVWHRPVQPKQRLPDFNKNLRCMDSTSWWYEQSSFNRARPNMLLVRCYYCLNHAQYIDKGIPFHISCNSAVQGQVFVTRWWPKLIQPSDMARVSMSWATRMVASPANFVDG
jgi:hypothetical protein